MSITHEQRQQWRDSNPTPLDDGYMPEHAKIDALLDALDLAEAERDERTAERDRWIHECDVALADGLRQIRAAEEERDSWKRTANWCATDRYNAVLRLNRAESRTESAEAERDAAETEVGKWIDNATSQQEQAERAERERDEAVAKVAHILASDWLAEQIAAAEQRGREDNADHGMCYVSGSKALAERDAEVARAAKAEALREAADYVTPKNWTGPNGTLLHLNHWLTTKAERLEVPSTEGEL